MQSTCTEATRSATLSTSLCQRRSKSWGTGKMQDTKSPSWPRARSSRLRSWLLTSREICGALGKEQDRESEPLGLSMAKFGALRVISQEEELKPRKRGKLVGPQSSPLGKGIGAAGVGAASRVGAGDGAERPQNSQAARCPKSHGGHRGWGPAHLWVPISIGHLK